jgi:hypothetical protein
MVAINVYHTPSPLLQILHSPQQFVWSRLLPIGDIYTLILSKKILHYSEIIHAHFVQSLKLFKGHSEAKLLWFVAHMAYFTLIFLIQNILTLT